jgi:hypothetical protein
MRQHNIPQLLDNRMPFGYLTFEASAQKLQDQFKDTFSKEFPDLYVPVFSKPRPSTTSPITSPITSPTLPTLETPLTNIIVSRYKRNVDFAYHINNGMYTRVMVYEKENPEHPYNVPKNKGNEASVYLKHIIDFYDELSEYTFFIHDEEYSWHHSGSILEQYHHAVNSGKKYYNINDIQQWSKPHSIQAHRYHELLEWYQDMVEDYIPLDKVPNNKDFVYGYRGSAQFLVHRDNIRLLPKQFYQRMYDWILNTDLPNWKSGRFLEWTWHVFWDIYPSITPVNPVTPVTPVNPITK